MLPPCTRACFDVCVQAPMRHLNALEGDGVAVAKQFEGEFEAGVAPGEDLLLTQVVLIAAAFPGHDGADGERFTGWPELFFDVGVGEAVIEHLVDLVTDRFGELSDFAVGPAFTFENTNGCQVLRVDGSVLDVCIHLDLSK